MKLRPYRIVLADDHAIVRQGMKGMIEEKTDLTVVGEAGDGFAAAAPFMRRQLGQHMRLRVVPSLEFLRDTSYEYGDRMERLFDRLSDEGLLPQTDGDENEPEDTK